MAKNTKVVRIKPVSSGIVRVELGFTLEDFRIAREFDPRSLQVVNTDKVVLFSIEEAEYAAIGKEVLRIPSSANEGNVAFLLQGIEETDISMNSALANVVRYGKTIDAQIVMALKAYKEASELITVEGEESKGGTK